MSTRRHQDWPNRLERFIASRKDAAFEWGKNDCCLFACDAIAELTGMDPAAPTFRGTYDTALGAARLLNDHGGVEKIAETVTTMHDFAELPTPMLAQRGDLVLVDTESEGPALGICVGAEAAITGPQSLTFIPVGRCRRAWRIN